MFNMSDRYGPSNARRNPRKKPRYESSSDDGHSAVYSEKDGDSDSGGSYIPASTASSRKRSSSRSHSYHNHSHHHHHRDHSRSTHRSHSQRHHHQRSHRHSHHHRRQKLLTEDGEKPRDGSMTLAVREDRQLQTVPRAHHHDESDSDGEEVYDHRPKPLSHRGHSHAGVSVSNRGGARAQQASDADKGFFMAAAALAVSLIICCGDADND